MVLFKYNRRTLSNLLTVPFICKHIISIIDLSCKFSNRNADVRDGIVIELIKHSHNLFFEIKNKFT